MFWNEKLFSFPNLSACPTDATSDGTSACKCPAPKVPQNGQCEGKSSLILDCIAKVQCERNFSLISCTFVCKIGRWLWSLFIFWPLNHRNT